ncbi:hypothetical protein SARC_01774 [Sphaeroforma arctica JP610]|uniref:Uncharacterized protein n=1 Tax=Sphaeroforma arctica JP610 TaxID=667725 RepID=A0A0L0GAV6_9EUKA|nr:hypothetical protein SARC_01774 [Sphaeroforma arctica JP610]KNC86049.1 hypothetical protein SARC_01774 [Sphaeroforma arctica JP610]|eukprot:XP_014159951.1 hypothetical protein SARC_01774 [Sphaeroforma arctica JP610]
MFIVGCYILTNQRVSLNMGDARGQGTTRQKVSLVEQVKFMRENGRDEELARMKASLSTSRPVEAMTRQTEEKIYKATENVSKSIFMLAHEPSIGLNRIMEHVGNSVPRFAEKKYALKQDIERLQGTVFDATFSLETLKGIGAASGRFQSMSDILTETTRELESSSSATKLAERKP